MRVRKSAQERKTQIIETTLRLAGERGPERLTTEAIATAVGITQPGLFRHFPTKDQLWQGVAHWMSHRLEITWEAAIGTDGSANRQLRALVRAQLELIDSIPAIPAILFSQELHLHRESLRQGFYGLMKGFQEILAGVIERGQLAGIFRHDLVAPDAALLVISVIQATTLRWSLSGRAFDLVTEGERLFDQLLRGLVVEGNPSIEPPPS